jgi:hypothetical protein
MIRTEVLSWHDRWRLPDGGFPHFSTSLCAQPFSIYPPKWKEEDGTLLRLLDLNENKFSRSGFKFIIRGTHDSLTRQRASSGHNH